MTHPSNPEPTAPGPTAPRWTPSGPEPTVPLHPTGPATPRWAPSAAEPTVQLPVTQDAPTQDPSTQHRPSWVPLTASTPAPAWPPAAPQRHPVPAPWPPQPPQDWAPAAPNPYETAPAVSWALQPDPRQLAYQQGLYAAQKSRVGAGVLGLLLGVFGVHNFYLGRSGVAVLQLLLTVLSLGILAPLVWVWSVVEGILILVGSPSFAADRRGIPLR